MIIKKANVNIYFSLRVYNSIVCETINKIKTETGGILLGIQNDNDWLVIENIDPGPNSIFTRSYFEYDTPYVNHLAKAVAIRYSPELSLLGLWHRHPGSFDKFSSTDDGTNTEYAKLSKSGAISGIVNLDPDFRLTMYHVGLPLKYTRVEYKVKSDDFFRQFVSLKYIINKNVDFDKVKSSVRLENETKFISTYQRSVIKKKKKRKRFIDFFFVNIEEDNKVQNENIKRNLPENKTNFRNNTSKFDSERLIIQNNSDEVSDEILDIILYEEEQLEQYDFKFETEILHKGISYKFNTNSLLNPIVSFKFLYLNNIPLFSIVHNNTKVDYPYKQDIFPRYIRSKIYEYEFKG